MKGAVKIVLIYLLVGFVWIYCSDRILLWMDSSGNLEKNTTWQNYKGFGFIIITGIVLFFLIKRHINSLERKTEELFKHENKVQKLNLVESRFKAFAIHGEDMITMFDENNERFYCSPNIERILGYTIDEFNETNAFNFNHPDDAEETKRLKAAVMQNPGKSCPFLFRIKHKNGNWVWVEGAVINLLNVGEVKAIISNFRDVTEQKLIQQRLRQRDDSLYLSNERFRLVSKATRDTIWDCDLKTEEILWNIGLATNFGHADKATNYNTKWWYSCVHPEDVERVVTKLDNSIRFADEIWEDEYRFKDALGNYRYVLDRGLISYDINNVPQRMIGAMQDVTLLKQSERTLMELNEELKKKASELALSNNELERFAYVASHDLQEPLRMIKGFLFLLEKEFGNKLDETAKQYIQFAIDGSERMKVLILDLLEYSKASGLTQESFTDVDINEVLKEVKSTFAPIEKDKEIELEYSVMPIVKANKTQIIQLFQNLIGNAIKYAKKGEKAKIQIYVHDNPGDFLFEVKDNGIGIKDEFLEEIFVIFKRLHIKSEYSGTGIGLATCKKIVEAHKGKIWAESVYMEGSTFKFTLKK